MSDSSFLLTYEVFSWRVRAVVDYSILLCIVCCFENLFVDCIEGSIVEAMGYILVRLLLLLTSMESFYEE
jgi:hypothetical protein